MHKRVIDERFELVERLGGGGMGLVWRAWDVALHREVALKEVRPPDPSMDEQDPTGARALRARVLREARALARLNHPHVATIHHIVDPGEQGYPWIVMELVSGGSLQDRIQRGPMPPADVARLGREVLSALRAAHAVGIQHRDVKPANVLLREDGRSVLTDFGIAAVRESTSLTATGSFIGSPEYMAPERINGVEGDPASDLWSLGMLLYVAVEGRHPLRRSTTLATLAAVLNQDVPPAERAGPLGPVLNALLRRDPAARPDAESLDRMLASAADPFPPASPGPAQGAQPAPWQATPPGHGHGPSQPSGHAQGPSHSVPPGYGQGPSHSVPPGHGQGPSHTVPPGYGQGTPQHSGQGSGPSPTVPPGHDQRSSPTVPPGHDQRSSPTVPPGHDQRSSPAGPHGHDRRSSHTMPPGHGQGMPAGYGQGPPPPAYGQGAPASQHAVPPGYDQGAPPPWDGRTPGRPAGAAHSRRSRRGPRNAVIAVSAAAVVIAGVLVWRLLPPLTAEVPDPQALQRTGLPTSAPKRTGDSTSDPFTPADSASPEATDDRTGTTPGNLHTPAGIRAMIAKVKLAVGGSKVVRMAVYPTYASIEAPIKGDPELYDRYDYRDGEVTRSGIGGKVDKPMVDLDKYNWNALPALFKTANKDLGVPKPSSRYFIVDPDYVFTTPRQVLLVYVSDGYRSGYLVANLQGKVIRKYPDD
ncbi:serine/threonine-protein kinase [Nonomuraea zeae]|uniref:serine/threonine-protein kinase n=1 Tax=Nonomuraea zeae TaxID=1642303 RepID=UPI001F10BD74|nr:serine/threonine-protein kinase [Nonomuraea zeae]